MHINPSSPFRAECFEVKETSCHPPRDSWAWTLCTSSAYLRVVIEQGPTHTKLCQLPLRPDCKHAPVRHRPPQPAMVSHASARSIPRPWFSKRGRASCSLIPLIGRRGPCAFIHPCMDSNPAGARTAIESASFCALAVWFCKVGRGMERLGVCFVFRKVFGGCVPKRTTVQSPICLVRPKADAQHHHVCFPWL